MICWRYVCMLTTKCQQQRSPVGTVFICLPTHLQCRVILFSCLLLHLCFTCWELYKSPLKGLDRLNLLPHWVCKSCLLSDLVYSLMFVTIYCTMFYLGIIQYIWVCYHTESNVLLSLLICAFQTPLELWLHCTPVQATLYAPSCRPNILWEPITLYQRTGSEPKAITDLKTNHITGRHHPECNPQVCTWGQCVHCNNPCLVASLKGEYTQGPRGKVWSKNIWVCMSCAVAR